MSLHKSTTERVLQALGFEALAILIATPLFAWAMGTPLMQMGVLTLANCVIAMLWNVGFNTIFDRALRRAGRAKTVPLRVLHAVLFEAGLFAATLPLAMWWLGVGLSEAFALEVGMVLFFMPYAYVYHWGYDVARARLVARRARRSSATSA
ncbi:PACE efflux transporter [Derxia lacustris]|uniref:PACE efflux transporter n=1 Tax=Derxia lacustris TaxID=764842 RepID=UPI000A16ED68|nr:PACE efflux transporter [Derxia lacustris]